MPKEKVSWETLIFWTAIVLEIVWDKLIITLAQSKKAKNSQILKVV
jgi:hypothetical protein